MAVELLAGVGFVGRKGVHLVGPLVDELRAVDALNLVTLLAVEREHVLERAEFVNSRQFDFQFLAKLAAKRIDAVLAVLDAAAERAVVGTGLRGLTLEDEQFVVAADDAEGDDADTPVSG